MNQIFRVIWSQATQTWVAVSELTKAHKKQSATSTTQESAVKFLGHFFKLSTLTFAMLGATQAYAAITAATVANEVPDTTPTDLLKGVKLSAQADSKNQSNNPIPTKLDNGTPLTYIGGDGKSTSVVAYDLATQRVIGLLSSNDTNAMVTEGELVNTLNKLRTQYVSINSSGGTNQYNSGAYTYTEALNAIAIGKNAVATDAGSIALGYGAKNERIVEKGQSTTTQPSELQRATNAVSIGTNALTTYSGAIALGFGAEARGQSSIVIGENAKTFSPWNAKEGKYDQAFRSILIGYNTEAGNTNGIGIGTRAQTWSNDGIVIGRDSIVNHPDSIVIGREAKSKGGLSQGIGTITIGQGASASSADNNRSSVAIGKQSYTGASFGIAVNTYPKDDNGVLTSTSKNVIDGANMSYNSTAIGSNAGTGYNIVDIVNTATTDSAGKAVAAGTVVKRAITRDANGNPTGVVFYTSMADDGKGNITYATVDASKVASGYAGNMGTYTDNTETVLKKAGFNTSGASLSYREVNASTGATTENAKAFVKTTGTSNEQTALGAESRAVGNSSTAIGTRAIAGDSTVAIGSSSGIDLSQSYFRVHEAFVPTYRQTAYGSRDDLNLNATYPSNSSGDANKTIGGKYTDLTGRTFDNVSKLSAPYGIAGSVVLGNGAHSSAPLGVAQGLGSSVMKGALGSVAIGSASTVDLNSAGAFAAGLGAVVDVESSGAIALGAGATARGRDTTKFFDTNAALRGTNAIAIGAKSTADLANSVALGAGSTTVGNSATREKEGTLTKEIAPGVIETLTYGTFFGTPGVGTKADEASEATAGYMISVGDASTNTYRQIKNVAAGQVSEKSTDAINGSQLFAVTKFVTDGWKITGNTTATTVENIMPRERVSFVNGLGTTSSVVANADGGADVTFNVTKGEITATKNDSNVATGSVSYTAPNTSAQQTALTAAQAAQKTAQDAYNAANKANTDNPTDATRAALATATQNLTAANAAVNTAQNNLNNAGNQFATAENVANAINNSGFNLTTSATTGGTKDTTGTQTTPELINPGKTVEMIAGKNLTVKQDKDGKITFATADDVNFNTVQIGGNTGPKLSADGNNIKIGDKDGNATSITNLKPNLDETQNNTAPAGQESNATKSKAAPVTTGDNATVNTANAATVGDILNAGWNLQGNGNAVDFVKPYDTVNFENGTNTTVVTSTDGATSNIKINVTGLPITYTDANGNQVAKADDGKWYPVDSNGSPDKTKTAVDAGDVKTNLANANPTDGKTSTTSPTQLGNVTSGLTNYTDANNSGVTPRNNIVNLGDANNGGVSNNTAATVGDLRNMGWVVSSDKTTGTLGTAYSDAVKNANEVKFVGINGAIVSGKTDDKGVRTITVSMDTAGITNNPNGSAISDAQKAADDAKKALNEAIAKNTSTPTPDNQKAVENAQKAYDDANKAVTEAGNKLVTANTVTNAINNSGWNLQNNGEQKDLVKPSDIVNFVNGGNTVANVTTAEDGKSSDVTFNVVGLPTTFTTADGSPVSKVGDSYYKVDKNGQPVSDAGKPAVGKNADGKYVDADGTVINPIDTANNPLQTKLVNPNVANTDAAPNNQTTTATQLGNVANGANTFEAPKVDASGNELTKVGDQYYTADQLVNGQPKEGEKGLVQGNDGNIYNADDLNNGVPKDNAKPAAEGVKLANDGKWYPASQVGANGAPTTGATAVTPSNPGNAGLIDFANSNPNNAATVGDLQNMGWVVSTSDKDGKETYNNQVRNNNKVDFTGEGLATVTGKTLEDGTRQITVSVKTGEVVPTDRDQNSGKATIKDKDGKDQTIDVVKASDGNWYPADQVTRTTDTNGNTVINPNQGATAIAQNNVTVPNAGSGLVTGNQVGDAIQQSGWNVGLADKAKADEAFGDSSKALSADKLEKVNPDDNVRFADGKGTKVSAATVEEINKDGKKVTNTYVKVDIDAGEVKANENGSVSGPVTQALKDAATAAKTAADAAQTALNDAQTAYNNAKPEEKDALKAKLDTAQAAFNNANTALTNANNAVTNAGNQVATAQNVADAINNSGFNLKTSGNKVPGTQDNGELIKPSNTVEMIAGKNLTVKQDTNGKVTYETANDVQFNSVQFGGNNGPKIDSNGSALNVNGAKIDGVADGDISPNSKEAVNGGQIYALTRGDVPNTTNITTTVTNPDGSTTTKTYENVISDKDGKPILTTYNVYGQTEVITNSTLTAIRNMNEQGIKFFHTNDAEVKPIVEDQNKIDSSASGAYATAVGFQAKANGTNAVAMGKGSQALAENTIAIGAGNIVSATKSGAFGDPNYIDGKEVDGVATVSGSYAFGNDNVINSSNTFVLGNNVNNKGTTTNGRPDAIGTTVENSVYLGNQTTATAGDGSRTGTLRNLDVNGNQGATTTAGSTGTVSQAVVGNLTYGGFAGAKANGVVSVGAAGSERRIQNVAAGEISATSTDAINGSQLYSVARGVSNLAGQVNKMGKRMDANAAAAMAAANLLQAYREGQSAVTAGVGQHRGQAAVAVGYSRLSDSGKIGIKFSLSADTQGEVSTGAGIGYFW